MSERKKRKRKKSRTEEEKQPKNPKETPPKKVLRTGCHMSMIRKRMRKKILTIEESTWRK